MTRPSYFQQVRDDAAEIWASLEARPELAGPWKQLFRQVTNSPRHVLSELLQNADDTGATLVDVQLDESHLAVSHNGRDFTQSDFAALCRFGSSNKGSLHTIGFRGIGFKSAFSVGQTIELRTPSLRVRFDQGRFTLPVWLDECGSAVRAEQTEVRIALSSPAMKGRLQGYLHEWEHAPLSLLFFNHLRTIRLNGAQIGYRLVGPGPVEASERFVPLAGGAEVLLVRGAPEPVPSDAIAEIQSERGEKELDLPSVSVQIVLGGAPKPTIHVVLPTEVLTGVPFGCNGPFIQDPARTGIKDPLLSPTNRWLLDRIGRLAADTIVRWVGDTSQTPGRRAAAYQLLPAEPSDSLDAPANGILQGMKSVLTSMPLALASDEQVHFGSRVLLPVKQVQGIWTKEELARLFDADRVEEAHPAVADDALSRLARWGGGRLVTRDDVVRRIEREPEPARPQSEGLRRLWKLLAYRSERWWEGATLNPDSSFCVPAYSSGTLHRSSRVVRLGAGEAELSNPDREFLTRLVPTADLEFASDPTDRKVSSEFGSLMASLNLDRPVGVTQLVHKVGAILREKCAIDDLIHLGRLAGLNGVALEPDFPLVTGEGQVLSLKHGVLRTDSDELFDLLPEAWLKRHRMSDRYLDGLSNADMGVWYAWSRSARAGLRRFPLPQQRTNRLTEAQARQWSKLAGGKWPDRFELKSRDFALEERDFEVELVRHWESRAAETPAVWGKVLTELIALGWPRLEPFATERLYQVGYSKRYELSEGHARWIRRLKNAACIRDEAGQARLPAMVLRLGPRTAMLQGIEPFIAPELDTPDARGFLTLLGVREEPTDPGSLLQRLRQLSVLPQSKVEPVLQIYRALDRIWHSLSDEQRAPIRQAFSEWPLALSERTEWWFVRDLARTNPSGIPAIALVHPVLAQFGFLEACGLAPHPSREQVTRWLVDRVECGALAPADRDAARQALRFLGVGAHIAVDAWLTDSAELRKLADLRYFLPEGGKPPELFAGIRRVVAVVVGDAVADGGLVAGKLRNLTAVAQRKVVQTTEQTTKNTPVWWVALIGGLQRIKPTSLSPADRAAVERLLQSRWRQSRRILVELWDGSTQLGPPQQAQAVWDSTLIHVSGRRVEYEAELAEEFARVFNDPHLQALVKRAVGRDGEYVAELFDDLVMALPAALPESGSSESPTPTLAEAELSQTVEPSSSNSAVVAGRAAQGIPASEMKPVVPVGIAATGSASPQVAILGHGGLVNPSTQEKPSHRRAKRTARSWVWAARAWLQGDGFSKVGSAKREEWWRHPDGRTAVLRAAPVHVTIAEPGTGAITQVLHVLPESALRGKAAPVLHETWSSLQQHNASSFFLVVDGGRLRRLPFGLVATSGETYPAAYMIRLPRSAREP